MHNSTITTTSTLNKATHNIYSNITNNNTTYASTIRRSVSLPNIYKFSSQQCSSSSIRDNNYLNQPTHYDAPPPSYFESVNITYNNLQTIPKLPKVIYLDYDSAKYVDTTFTLSPNGKYLAESKPETSLGLGIGIGVRQLSIYNIEEKTTEFFSGCLHQVNTFSDDNEKLLFHKDPCITTGIEEPRLMIKNKINTTKKTVSLWEECYWKHRNYNSLPAYCINSVSINVNSKILLASYKKYIINIWSEGEPRKTSVLKRNKDTWNTELDIKIDSTIRDIKFDKHRHNLYVLTQNNRLKIFYQTDPNHGLWEEKDSVTDCKSFPSYINNTDDTMVFIKGKSLTIRSKKHTTDQSWNLFSCSFLCNIVGFSFLPDENEGFLIYLGYKILRYNLDHTLASWVKATEETTQQLHKALEVLSSSDHETNILIYSSKEEEKNNKHTARNIAIGVGIGVAATAACTIL